MPIGTLIAKSHGHGAIASTPDATVGPMTAGELQEAIERPALQAGLTVEQGLPATDADGLHGSKGSLELQRARFQPPSRIVGRSSQAFHGRQDEEDGEQVTRHPRGTRVGH